MGGGLVGSGRLVLKLVGVGRVTQVGLVRGARWTLKIGEGGVGLQNMWEMGG